MPPDYRTQRVECPPPCGKFIDRVEVDLGLVMRGFVRHVLRCDRCKREIAVTIVDGGIPQVALA